MHFFIPLLAFIIIIFVWLYRKKMNTQPQIITPNIDLPTIQVPVKSIEKKKAYIDQHDFHHNDIQIKTPRYEPDATDAYSLEEQLEKLALTGQLDIMKFNILIEAFLKNDASPLEIKDLLIFIISKDSDPLQLQSREKTVLFNQLFQLKPNIFTYSMLFKTMQIELKKTRNPILQKQLEDKYLSEANHYWYEILKQDNELIPNIIVLNQYISIYLQANQNSNALQLYREYLEKVNFQKIFLCSAQIKSRQNISCELGANQLQVNINSDPIVKKIGPKCLRNAKADNAAQ